MSVAAHIVYLIIVKCKEHLVYDYNMPGNMHACKTHVNFDKTTVE